MVFEAEQIDWSSTAGRLPDDLAATLPPEPRAEIVRPVVARANLAHSEFDTTLVFGGPHLNQTGGMTRQT